MKLTAKARYAARLLLDLAEADGDEPVRASQLAENTDISAQFIEQILRPLKKAGFIESLRGASGGHRLIMDPADISLGDVVRTMEGEVRLTKCCADPTTCNRSSECRTHQAWQRISRIIENELDAITLADLMGDRDLFEGFSD